jgi:UDP-2-acetamido-2-deoxy-ribo-hexuluronate aminotransferase
MQFIDLQAQYKRIEADVLMGIKAVLDHGQYIMGPEIKTLEERLAMYAGVKHVIVNASGTDALLMALLALEIQPGDEVITSPFSFFATVEVLALVNAKPVFVDIDPITYNINANAIEQAITAKTKAIMPVSLYGQCAELDTIQAIARKHGIAVIEDAAQSFGATHHGKPSCSISDIGCTSFFPSKPLGGYGDSGACFTDDDVLAERLREIRVHGQSARYLHTRVGINGRMDTIQAAILIEKLKLFAEEEKLRQKVAQRYSQLLSPFLPVPQVLSHNTSVYAQYTIEVNHRDAFIAAMQEQGIPTAVHYPIAMHMQPALAYLGHQLGEFPHAEKASASVVSLPMHPYLSEANQDEVVHAVRHSLSVIAEI